MIANGGRDRNRWIPGDLAKASTIAEGESPFVFSVHVQHRQWLEDRRHIESFFIREVDRDKMILAGTTLERACGSG